MQYLIADTKHHQCYKESHEIWTQCVNSELYERYLLYTALYHLEFGLLPYTLNSMVNHTN